MTLNGWLQIALYCVIVTLLVKPFGLYLTRVFAGERTLLSPIFVPLERLFYRLSGVDERREQGWVAYAVAMLLFSLAGFLLLYALMRLQALLPFNPAGQAAVEPGLAFSIFISMCFTWVGNRYLTFRGKRAHSPSGILQEWLKFIGANAVGAVVNYAVSVAVVHFASQPFDNKYFAQACGVLAGLVFNFTLSSKIVFRG